MNENQEFYEIEIKEDEPVFTTGVVTRLIKVPIWVLKQLDNEGIVTPQRQARKARLYSKRDLRKVKKIWYLMEKRKVTVNGIKVILEIERGIFKEI